MRAGLDLTDFDDKDIQECLGVYDEVKKGLYGSEDDNNNDDNSKLNNDELVA